jgi:Ca2+-binding RTX toxin-like protein
MPTIFGSSRNDILHGAPGPSISAGAGDDQIYVEYDAETVTGGSGSDVLIIVPGASRAVFLGVNHPENLAHFTDWSPGDILVFITGPDGGRQV